MKVKIVIEIEDKDLPGFTDQRLVMAWHAVQHSPAPFGDHDTEVLAERIGREIISRWLKNVRPELYQRQGSHVGQDVRTAMLEYVPPPGTDVWPGGDPHPDFHYGTYRLRQAAAVEKNLATMNADRQAALAARQAARGDQPADDGPPASPGGQAPSPDTTPDRLTT